LRPGAEANAGGVVDTDHSGRSRKPPARTGGFFVRPRGTPNRSAAAPYTWRVRTLTTPLACWGNTPVQSCVLARPEKRRELVDLLREPPRGTLISRGMGRSYGDASLNENAGVVLHERLNRFLAFDAASGTLECEGGASLSEIIDAFLPRGFFPAVTPGTRFVTVGGMIAADVHGKNHHTDGSIASFVDSFRLLTPARGELSCSRDENADLYFATLGGMGLTGIITRARLRLQRVASAFVTVTEKRAKNLEECAAQLQGDFAKSRYSVAWIDCLTGGKSLGRAVVMGGEHAGAHEVARGAAGSPLVAPVKGSRSVPFFFPGGALNSLTCRAFNAVYYRAHPDTKKTVAYAPFFYPLDSVLHWNRIYGRRGFQQYQVVIPFEAGVGALAEILAKIAESGRASFLAVLKTFGGESGGLLSFPRPGWTLSLDLPNARGLNEFLSSLDERVIRHGGRRYLAKDAGMKREHFEAMYPRLAEFRGVRASVDPEGKLSSSLGRRLGLS